MVGNELDLALLALDGSQGRERRDKGLRGMKVELEATLSRLGDRMTPWLAGAVLSALDGIVWRPCALRIKD